jgi:hypothetical protein
MGRQFFSDAGMEYSSLCSVDPDGRFFRLEEARLELVLEPVGTAANVEGDGLVQNAIEDGSGDDAAAEELVLGV